MTGLRRRYPTGWAHVHGRGPRNVYGQPFHHQEIWNHPICDGATYADAGLAPAEIRHPLGYPEVVSDPENIGLNPTTALVVNMGVPADHPGSGQTVLIAPTVVTNGKNNNSSGVLNATDLETLYEGQPLGMTPSGTPIGYVAGQDIFWRRSKPAKNIYGSGITGAHGGAGMSAVGGSLRAGELAGLYPILHAMKLDVYGRRFLSQASTPLVSGAPAGPGWVWPADRADSGAFTNKYAGESGVGANPVNDNWYGRTGTGFDAMRMGTLLAIHPDEDLSWITSHRVKRIAAAWRDFGIYIVDNTTRDVHAIAAERGAFPEIPSASDRQFHLDLMALISLLQIVTNNGPNSIGGGGRPRVEMHSPVWAA